MKGLGQRYVRYINRTYRRSGTLFEGRFRSPVVEGDRYLFACQRYIELNPVRPHRVPIPEAYRWSSYRCNALGEDEGEGEGEGEGEANAIVAPHPLYLTLAETDDARRAAYRNLFADTMPEDALKSTPGCDQWRVRLGKLPIPATDRRDDRPTDLARKSGRPKKEPRFAPRAFPPLLG